MTMSKTAAIRTASQSVSISGRKTSWTVYGPYHDDQPSGPSTEISADSYNKAVAIAACKKARIALALMGRLNDDTKTAVEWAHYNGDNDMRSLVNAGLVA